MLLSDESRMEWILLICGQYWAKDTHVFPYHLMEVPPFPTWVRSLIVVAIKNGDVIERDVVHMLMPPTFEAESYWAMWTFGNYIHVSSVKKHLTTFDNGVVATFEQECVMTKW